MPAVAEAKADVGRRRSLGAGKDRQDGLAKVAIEDPL